MQLSPAKLFFLTTALTETVHFITGKVTKDSNDKTIPFQKSQLIAAKNLESELERNARQTSVGSALAEQKRQNIIRSFRMLTARLVSVLNYQFMVEV